MRIITNRDNEFSVHHLFNIASNKFEYEDIKREVKIGQDICFCSYPFYLEYYIKSFEINIEEDFCYLELVEKEEMDNYFITIRDEKINKLLNE